VSKGHISDAPMADFTGIHVGASAAKYILTGSIKLDKVRDA
jgi:hypothetical protein